MLFRSAGQTPMEIMESTLEDYRVLELKGSVMDELMYFIDQDTPVLAKTANDQAILLIGYSANYVYYYEPISGQTRSADYAQMDAMFQQGGNYFITYVR